MTGKLLVKAASILLATFAVRTAMPQVGSRSAGNPDELQQLGLIIPMRDGVGLAADLYIPRGGGRWPTVLVRTPYGRKATSMGSYRFFARRGFAVVIEDVRGRHASQGTLAMVNQEGPDGSDTINWISEQAWSNGRVAMAGSSYLRNYAMVGSA